MRGKLMFVAGAGVGYVLGSRAGRERYEDIRNAAKKLLDSPTVQEAAGVAQAQASKLYAHGKETFASSGVSDRLRHTLGGHGEHVGGLFDDDDRHQHMSSNSF